MSKIPFLEKVKVDLREKNVADQAQIEAIYHCGCPRSKIFRVIAPQHGCIPVKMLCAYCEGMVSPQMKYPVDY